MHPKLPRLPHAFFKWYCRKDRYEEIHGDLEEYFYQRAKTNPTKAKLLYLWDVIRCCQPYAWRKTNATSRLGSTAMISNFLSIAFRRLLKDKSYFSINISGLALGIASFVFIALYVTHELSYDQFHPGYENIYRVSAFSRGAAFDRAVTNSPLARTLLNDYPEVVDATRILKSGPHLISKGEEKINEEVVLFGDPAFFRMFNVPFIKGNPANALVDPRSLILSESYSEKYFGDANPLGQQLAIDGDTALYVVTGVFENIPGNSHLQFDIMGSLSTRPSWNDDKWVSGPSMHTYIRLEEGANEVALLEKMQGIVRKYMGPEIEFHTGLTFDEWNGAGNKAGFTLIPVKDIHLRSTSADEFEATGNILYVYIYSVVGFAILAIAIFNFVNLATARSGARAKEVGVRKVIGSSRRQLVFQFTIESVLVSLTAAVIAIILVVWMMPVFSQLMGKQLAFGILNTMGISSIIGLAIFVGVLAGIYPAFVLSALQPVRVLKGLVTENARSGLRSFLVTMQFTASIVIIICTLVIYRQIDFMVSHDLGFDKDQVLVIRDPYGIKNLEAFKNTVMTNPGVVAVANSKTIPGRVYDIRSYRKKDEAESYIIKQNQVSYEYHEMMGLELVAGRFFSKEYGTDDNAIVINEAAAKFLGYDDPVGKTLVTPWKKEQLITIIGVVKDYRIGTLHTNIEPMAMELVPGAGAYISIKLKATNNVHEIINQVANAWSSVSSNPFQYFFLDEEYEKLYRSESNTGSVMTIFAALSIFISSLGLIGLIMHIASVRKKEIGIRKVLGASSFSVMRLLSSEFIKLVVIATLVSWPIAYFASNHWLTTFAERAPLDPWLYLGATIVVAIIGSLAISYQAVSASLSNPVNSLKAE